MISLDGRASVATDGRGIINVNLTGQGGMESKIYSGEIDFNKNTMILMYSSVRKMFSFFLSTFLDSATYW